MMGLSFGTLGILVRARSSSPVALRDPVAFFSRDLSEIRSLFLAIVFVIVTLILAYLTNPSEASFRTYLTELSFRRHLSRLYDAQDPEPGDHDYEASGLHTPKRRPHPPKHPNINLSTSSLVSSTPSNSSVARTTDIVQSSTQAPSNISGFHFANRASVSLRTSGHVFRSLGILTIAAVPIVSDDEECEGGSGGASIIASGLPMTHSPPKRAEVTLAGSWFVGIFGKWWLGGRLQLRQQNDTGHAGLRTMQFADKEERFSAGVLSIRALDYDPVTEGPKNIAETLSALTSKSQSRKVSANGGRNGDKLRSSRRSIANGHSINIVTPASPPPRSSSPPPLPKSASLPLHTARVLPASDNNRTAQGGSGSSVSHSRSYSSSLAPPSDGSLHPTISSFHPLSTNNTFNIPINSSTTSANGPQLTTPSLLDQSPIIIDILKQLSISQAEAVEARSQLAVFEEASASAHAALQSTLDGQRERKREEDVLRIDLKSRNKILEESKRQAEATKREAEKKLKTAHAARDRAVNRIESLGKDIDALLMRIQEDRERIVESKSQAALVEVRLIAAVNEKRREIKVAEDVIVALVLRAKELEAQIQDEMKALERAQEVAVKKRNNPSPHPIFVDHYRASSLPHASNSPTLTPIDTSAPSPTLPLYQRRQNVHGAAESRAPLSDSDRSASAQHPPSKDNFLSTSSAPSLASDVHEQAQSPIGPPLYISHSNAFGVGGQHRHFSPFADGGISPLAASLIPSSLFSSIEIDGGMLPASSHEDGSIYSNSKQQHTGDADDQNQSRLWQQQPSAEAQMRQSWDDTPEVLYTSPTNSNFFPSSSAPTGMIASLDLHPPSVESDEKDSGAVGKSSKRWFTSSSNSSTVSAKTKKESSSGLNPDAKVFSFTRGRSFLFPGHNGNGTRGASNTGDVDYGSTHGRHVSTASLPVSTVSSSPPPQNASSTTSFLSSLLAFTPSPAEREALQRALGQNYASMNGSVDRLSLSDHHTSPNLQHLQPQSQAHRNSLPLPGSAASPFTSPLPSARSSNVDLSQVPPHSGMGPGPGWAGLYLGPSSASASTSSLTPDPSAAASGTGGAKRSFSSLWNRKKTGTVSGASAGPAFALPTSGVSVVSEEEV